MESFLIVRFLFEGFIFENIWNTVDNISRC